MPHIDKEMISFFVTTSCNLACRYCYTNKNDAYHKDQTLDLDFAKAGIDDYFAKSSSRHIRFFGAGEPTTKLELLISIYNYAREKSGGKLTTEIQTNGIFPKKVANWLAENINIIWVSSDGTPDIQDYYRRTGGQKATSKFLADNVKYLLQNKSCNGVIGIRATITPKTIKRQIDIIDYFMSLGIKYIWCDPLFPTVGEKMDYQEFDFIQYASEYIKASKFANSLGMFYGSFLTCNFDGETNYHCRACIPAPHLTTDGYISACDMALFGKMLPSESHMSPLIYGKWDVDNKRIVYFEDKINILRSRNADNMPGCKGCPAIRYCAGYCLGEVTNETGDLFGQKSQVCDAIRYLYGQMGTSSKKFKYLHP